jgi:hypothetical protein
MGLASIEGAPGAGPIRVPSNEPGMVDPFPPSRTARPLAVVLAVALLFVLAVSVALSKLGILWSSQFTFVANSDAPVCVPGGPCFRFIGATLKHTTAGQAIPLRMARIDNLFELAKELDAGMLKAALIDRAGLEQTAEIQPSYNLFISTGEAVREIPALLLFHGEPPLGQREIVFERAGARSEAKSLTIERRDLGVLGELLVGAMQPAPFRLSAGLLILLLAAITAWTEAHTCAWLHFGGAVFAGAVLARTSALMAIAAIDAPILHLSAVLVILIPWLALTRVAIRHNAEAPHWAVRTTDHLAKSVPASLDAQQWRRAFSLLELGMVLLCIGLFAYMLWSGPSFRWSIFEERDLLEARRVLSERMIPLYGPELLLGGQTIGSGLYLLMAPVVAVYNDPAALLLFNRILFLGMALVLWWGVRDWVGSGAALLAVFALIASERIVALSYWPIHPNFSLFFAFLYACAVVRGAVAGNRGWLIFSGLLLGLLVQLHFSYFLLVPSHVILTLLANYQRDRWTKPLAALVFLIPLAPFLLSDASHGFPNIARIAQRPRFNALYPNEIFGNAGLLPLVFGWLRQVPGLLSEVTSLLSLLMIGLGVALALADAFRRAPITPSLAATVLFTAPAFELNVLGMGYNTRHTLTMVPALFILAGFGFAGVLKLLRLERHAPLLVLPLLAVLALRASNSATMGRIVSSEGEWAVDYNARQAIAVDLIGRLRLSPEAYQSRAYWWWVGWSIDPTVYAELYRRLVGSVAAQPIIWPDQYVLVTEAADLPPFLKILFEDQGSRQIGGMHVHVAMPRKDLLPPSSNADTGVRLQPFFQELDTVGDRRQGFSHIGRARAGTAQRDLFLAVMAQGRIKVLITTEHDEIEGRSRLRWCVDSPSLNGHYQEFKTLWRPRLIMQTDSHPVEARLASDVLGSLSYKTPRCGEAWNGRAASWQATFAFDGLFDQSFMLRPDLSEQRMPLDFNAPLRNLPLSQTLISRWIDARFDR